MILTSLIISMISTVVLFQPRQNRIYTDYYRSSDGNICVKLRHTLPRGSQFIRFRVEYKLNLLNEPEPKVDLKTQFYLVAASDNCHKSIEFSDLGKRFSSGWLKIFLSWTLDGEDVSTINYEFKNQLDSNIVELISEDELFTINAKFTHEGSNYMTMSGDISLQSGMAILSRLQHDNRALCVKIDNHDAVVMQPEYFGGNMPDGGVTQFKAHLVAQDKEIHRTFTAYACGSDPLPYHSNYRFIVDRPLPKSVEFHVVAKKYIYNSEKGEYLAVESVRRIFFNYSPFLYSNDNIRLYYPYKRIFLLNYYTGGDGRCDDGRKLFISVSQRGLMIFGNLYMKQEISQNAARYYWDVLYHLHLCQFSANG